MGGRLRASQVMPTDGGRISPLEVIDFTVVLVRAHAAGEETLPVAAARRLAAGLRYLRRPRVLPGRLHQRFVW